MEVIYKGSFFREKRETYGDNGYISPEYCSVSISIYDDKVWMEITPMDYRTQTPDPNHPPYILEFEKNDALAIGSQICACGKGITYDSF
jgi:hypothetical protein